MAENRSIFATLPRTGRGVPLVLGGDPKGKTFLYPNGNSIIIRDIANPAIADIYTEHTTTTTVAKYSPSGFYIASADQSGKLRIWDTTQKEHILKNEYQPFAGTIKDIAWSPDSGRIVVVGEGRERFGHVIMADTGTSVGEIAGHSKSINSCDFRPGRPFRIITGSEDNTIQTYEGPPFKFKHQIDGEHSKFVQAVRFAPPNGDLFASGGFDGKVCIFSTKDYSKVGELGEGGHAHTGGVYALAWSPDGTRLLTASGDKTTKLWDANTLQLISEFPMGTDLLDQQVSCLWQGDYLLSVSLSGFINYLDVNNPATPIRIIKGHNKSITALGVDRSARQIYTGSHDGFLTHWSADSGDHDRLTGGHSNQVADMSLSSDLAVTCGLDDSLRFISLPKRELVSGAEITKLESQPRGVAVRSRGGSEGGDLLSDVILVAGYQHVTAWRGGGVKLASVAVNWEPSSISINDADHVAVGGGHDMKVHVYKLEINNNNSANLTPVKELEQRGAITDVKYSPDGSYLAAADANRKIFLYDASSYELAHPIEWGFHTARVNCLAWSPDSLYLASGSLDTGIIIWSVKEPTKHHYIKKAHPMSQITRVAWLDESTLVSTGQDANVKLWQITFR